MEAKAGRVLASVNEMLENSPISKKQPIMSLELLSGDGSQREFYRLTLEDGKSFIAIVPGEYQCLGIEESLSSWKIGKHLLGKQVPVPEFTEYNYRSGIIISEDLGNLRLHEYIIDTKKDNIELVDLYAKVVQELVRMQVSGMEDFQVSWCWQTPCYDKRLMLERESGYFLNSLVDDFFAVAHENNILLAEFEEIADIASEAPAHYFMHRDFQSRNIMLKENQVRIIDFQGGRLGPLAYDLASLLLDPYVDLPVEIQEELLEKYIQILKTFIPYHADQFRREYTFLALQRNLQILGAFAFLSKQRGKVFFKPFIKPALLSLQSMLAKPVLRKYSALKNLTDKCLEKALQNEF